MSDFEKARMFGLIDIPYGQRCFRPFIDKYNPYSIETNGQPVRAMWQGNNIIVDFEDGETRIFSTLSPEGYYRVSK
jgi:hypothetical protein